MYCVPPLYEYNFPLQTLDAKGQDSSHLFISANISIAQIFHNKKGCDFFNLLELFQLVSLFLFFSRSPKSPVLNPHSNVSPRNEMKRLDSLLLPIEKELKNINIFIHSREVCLSCFVQQNMRTNILPAGGAQGTLRTRAINVINDAVKQRKLTIHLQMESNTLFISCCSSYAHRAKSESGPTHCSIPICEYTHTQTGQVSSPLKPKGFPPNVTSGSNKQMSITLREYNSVQMQQG